MKLLSILFVYLSGYFHKVYLKVIILILMNISIRLPLLFWKKNTRALLYLCKLKSTIVSLFRSLNLVIATVMYSKFYVFNIFQKFTTIIIQLCVITIHLRKRKSQNIITIIIIKSTYPMNCLLF